MVADRAGSVRNWFRSDPGLEVLQNQSAYRGQHFIWRAGKQLVSNDPKRINDAGQAVIDKFDRLAYALRLR